MADTNNPKIWLESADKEFDYASSDLKDEDQDYFAPTCFHFQQAAEKYLKAYILATGAKFRKVHNLIELLQVCAQKEKSFLDLKSEAATLNPFYTETRYPVHWPVNFTREDAEKAGEAAERIANFVKSKLKKISLSSPLAPPCLAGRRAAGGPPQKP